MKILILDYKSPYSIGELFRKSANYDVTLKDPREFNPIGFKNFLHSKIKTTTYGIEWNYNLLNYINNNKFDLILFFRISPISLGTIETIKIWHKTKFCLIWQDALVFLENSSLESYREIDLIACYSKGNTESFKKLGCTAFFLPLAHNPDFYKAENISKNYLINFLGTKTIYREMVIQDLINQSSTLKGRILISGPGWKKYKRKNVFIDNKVYINRDAARIYNQSKYSLNIIDPTNYPSANMRFFEINACNTTQISAEVTDLDNKSYLTKGCLFYKKPDELINIIRNNENLDFRLEIENRNLQISKNDTYSNRLSEIVKRLGL